ncbi:hypothetical protein GPECTOR_14g266 [Gonium pectorale]|uniref:Pherophorin domain-containing protein n=1 Tax=Gonium pectorale TaxID=33097 RepID=A0A150GME4_GONPE|nr:hypothetical protein GPECTOR_14g266 [Gonium pectorale]|eukprot:KXZ51026.1 hypothetical protein GPECTOR_14g266 [Gonium pectorale]
MGQTLGSPAPAPRPSLATRGRRPPVLRRAAGRSCSSGDGGSDDLSAAAAVAVAALATRLTQRNSPYYATLYSYRENAGANTSTVCLQVRVLPTCTPGKWRCCDTSINKLKVFPAEATCVSLGGHLAAIGSESENNFLINSIIGDLPPGGAINAWFGLRITTATTGAIPGFNTDGTRMSYTPANFQYDRLRSAVRYYMLSCSVASATCAWLYSPGGASDVQPSYVCEFT